MVEDIFSNVSVASLETYSDWFVTDLSPKFQSVFHLLELFFFKLIYRSNFIFTVIRLMFVNNILPMANVSGKNDT